MGILFVAWLTAVVVLVVVGALGVVWNSERGDKIAKFAVVGLVVNAAVGATYGLVLLWIAALS